MVAKKDPWAIKRGPTPRLANNRRQARFKKRNQEGLAVLRVEVRPQVMADTLARLGYPVARDRESLARTLERYLVDQAFQVICK
jgi:hypothetical protein